MKGYSRHEFERDGLGLAYYLQDGDGPCVLFQHGLCGDAQQPAEVFPERPGVRHLVLECRGHGASTPGDFEAFSIQTFSEDLAALLDSLGGGPGIVGGISMGAALSLRLACTRPDLVCGLILARPAWVCDNAPENMRPNLEVGDMLRHTASAGEIDEFLASPSGRRLAAQAPDNLASLSGFFARQPRDVTAALLTHIAVDGPGISEDQAAALGVPTLVIGTADDLLHPVDHAHRLADLIPGARFAEIPSKFRDKDAYRAAFRRELAGFIEETNYAQA